jgi:hypothetical protein
MQVGTLIGVAKQSIVAYLPEVGDFFMDIAASYITLPDPAEYDQLAGTPLFVPDRHNPTIARRRLAILFVDGFVARIQRPDHAGDSHFCGRHGKQCDSINTQIICDKFGLVRYVLTGLPGSMHDKSALEHSQTFQTFCDQLPRPYVVGGDKAYLGYNREKLLHPTKDVRGRVRTDLELIFNKQLSSQRMKVENVIGCLESKWRVLQLKDKRIAAKVGTLLASKLVIAACVLHNRFTNYITN